MRTLPVLIATLAAPALGSPEVVRFDPAAPFDPAFDQVFLTDSEPTAPDIRLGFFAQDPGGGSNAEVWHPWIIGAGWDPLGGSGLAVESNMGQPGLGYAGLLAGDVASPTTPGDWGFADWDVYYGAPPDNYPLALVAYETFPFQDSCRLCTYVFEALTISPGRRFVALRWEDGGETYYGWAAFEVRFEEYPMSCRINDDFSCPDSVFDDLVTLNLRYVAAGYQTEPNTPITVGGGLCRADTNFDARFDYFDVTAFLAAYTAGDPAADFTGDGAFDYFDVTAFIAEYNAGCDF